MLVLKSCVILCDPKEYSPPSPSVHGIFQAGTWEWVTIPFYRGSSQARDRNWASPALQADILPSESPRDLLKEAGGEWLQARTDAVPSCLRLY